MLRTIVALTILFQAFACFSQSNDTIRVMHYNLLNYRNNTNQCTETTNNADDKDGYLKEIVAHAKPDILTINEMGANWLNPNKILTNALNKDGVNYFDQAEFRNNGFSSLTNMLFFNSEKFKLYDQDVIEKDLDGDEIVRVIDVYTLYYTQDPDLAKGDTTFLTILVAHLKAGSTSSDKEDRAKATAAVMSYLESNKKAHAYLMAGDFNTRSASEDSYQNLTQHSNEDVRFYDPMDAAGSWNNKQLYANLHTQSTHVSDTRGGCFSGGGFDDRFDFILCGKEVMDNAYGVMYIEGSYEAMGQDSRRFNGDVLSPLNTKVPNAIARALYEMSDHLPVILDLNLKKNKSNVQLSAYVSRPIVTYPSKNMMNIRCNSGIEALQLIDMKGQLVLHKDVTNQSHQVDVALGGLNAGVYTVIIQTPNRGRLITKMVKSQ